ncbi:hypothetical protein SAMN05444274_101269 [Mariniphaga anaerophila]|uniref:Uncharacterized protein n=1 Tax=Mariniphaga anaerophila TaxID=1484053 RepID=A0A1M4T690_9BACT|nr:hypothetical protein [Mariniphaga anaerophila]SHE40026.1 hypothetical protein SAMN05444274_101269 [Mariniphaga anaerophila]
MKKNEIRQLLQRYFEGESTLNEEAVLRNYFAGDNVADELEEYTEFFCGFGEINETERDAQLEHEIMDFITENESKRKTPSISMWKTVSGIAASIVIAVGGILFFQHEEEPFKDTFDDPETAYVYAEKTLEFVSQKYSKGLSALANFDKIETATQPIKKGVKPINKYMNKIEMITEHQR